MAPAPIRLTVGIVAGIVPPAMAEEVTELIIVSLIVWDELIISVELITDETLIIVADVWLELLEELEYIWYPSPPTRIATMITAIIT